DRPAHVPSAGHPQPPEDRRAHALDDRGGHHPPRPHGGRGRQRQSGGCVLHALCSEHPARVLAGGQDLRRPWPILRAVRARFAAIAPSLALFDVHTMEERGDLALASRRASLTLAMFFGCLALFLSGVGIYGVLAYLVTQRQREIGIRAALGCTAGGVVKLVVTEAMWLLSAGLLLGAAGSVALRSVVAV